MRDLENLPESQENAGEDRPALTIISAMRNYEPVDFPQKGQEPEYVGSHVPNSFFMHGDRKIFVKTFYVFEDRELSIVAVDEEGQELTDVVDEYDVWSWQVEGRQEVEAEYQKMAQKETRCYATGTSDKCIFDVFDGKDVPLDSKKKYKVEKWKNQNRQTVLNLHAKIDEMNVAKICGLSPNNLGQGIIDFSNEKFQDILKQVASNMVEYVENPNLHITLDQLEDRLKPGRDSAAGFMAENEKLLDIIERDTETLKKNGVTFQDIADRISQLFDAVESGSKEVAIGSTYFRVARNQTRGVQFCPWRTLDKWHAQKTGFLEAQKYEQFGYVGKRYKCDGSADYEITNLKTGKTIKLPSMAPHLIGDHHFFEGSTDYRIDPQALIDVLEIKKTKSR